ncbi:ABC transporter ATP-binding protein [Holzapfeliella sp. He02]|uniref:ABC transporter ATP-binding protein n=1 Tax=Holzapfeliella saturejae TaxID=3082953 RepID=A0ABU8SIF3_9LACO
MVTATLYALVSIASATYYGYIVEHADNKNQALFLMMIVMGVTIVFLRWVFDMINQLIMVKFVGHIIYTIRQKMLQTLIGSSVSQFRKKPVSMYTSNVLNDVEMVDRDAIEPYFDFISQLVIVLISSMAVLYYQPIVFLVILLGTIGVFLIPMMMSQTLQKKQASFSNESANLTEKTSDILNGFDTIKSTQSVDEFLHDFNKVNHHFTRAKVSSGKWIMANYVTSSMLGMMVQYAAVLASIWFIMNGMITVGIMLTMVQTMNTLVFPLIDIFRLIPQIKSSKPIMDKIESLADADTVDVVDKTSPLSLNEQIKLKDISVTLDSKPILHDISLNLTAHKKYLLVGESGSGKSTLAQLLAGFIQDYQGQFLVDNQPLINSEDLFSSVSYVSQTPHLFNQTIKQNIVISEPFSESKFKRVLVQSGVNQFIENAQQLNESIKQNGQNYSGGQKQRIALARGIYQQKPMLVLDESLSGLNSKLSHHIEDQLLTLDSILVYITHQFDMSLIKHYDAIIWVENGRIKANQEPEQLLHNPDFQAFLDVVNDS